MPQTQVRRSSAPSSSIRGTRRGCPVTTARSWALASLLSALALPAVAAPTVFTDAYTLTTTNQSMWGSGTQAGFSYDSGLLGAAWGTYGSSGVPASFGLNAIIGSANTVLFPGTPEACAWGYCIGGTDPITADTRTGGALDGTTSGQVGLYVTAQANGGGLNVSVPVTSSLTIGEAGANGIFHVSGTNALGGGTITAIAPSFKAGLDGVLVLEASVKGTGCIALAGCTSSDPISLVDINAGRFSLVALDTSKTDPVSFFGLGWPYIQFGKEYAIRAKEPPCQGPPTQDGTPPKCPGQTFQTPAIGVVKVDNLGDLSGGTVNQNMLSLTTNQPVLRLTADVTGIAQYALGITADVLSPSVDVPYIGSLGGTVINVQAGVQFGLTQEFDFTPRLLAELQFDKPVTEYVKKFTGAYEQKCLINTPIGCLLYVDDMTKPIFDVVAIDRGTTVAVNLATGADLRFTSELGELLGRTYFMGNNSFTSDSRVSIDPTLPIKAGCLEVDSKVPGFDGVEVCAFEKDYRTTDLASFSVYKNTFSLGGFDTATFMLAGDAGSDPQGGNVPEASSLWLTLLALGALRTGRVGAQTRRWLAPR